MYDNKEDEGENLYDSEIDDDFDDDYYDDDVDGVGSDDIDDDDYDKELDYLSNSSHTEGNEEQVCNSCSWVVSLE